MRVRAVRESGVWVPLVGGLLCSLWAFVGWLAVVPNQDILADGIQAQSLLIDPRIVLSFPGQKHGGPLEYPVTVLSQWLWPGNYYADSLVRVLLAFLTGFFAAKLALTLFPLTRPWALLVAMAVGPTIIHGLQLPGVWWLQPNYDMAWMLITAGSLVLAHAMADPEHPVGVRRRLLVAACGGLLIGLGLFAHPVIILMAAPLVSLVLLRRPCGFRACLVAAIGVGIGLVPAVVSYFVNDEVNVWDPSHKPFVYPAWLWGMGRTALGLDGIPDASRALLPHAIGFSPTQTPYSGMVQSIVTGAVLAICLAVFAAGVWTAIRRRRWVGPGTALAGSWLVAAATMVLFITSADPVWHYSAGLAVLTWVSVGALPSLIPARAIGIAITIIVLVLMATSTWGQNSSYLSSLPDRIQAKQRTLDEWRDTAASLHNAGAEVIFGTYREAIPIGYVSDWGLRTVTNKYNRFPLVGQEADPSRSYVVAVRQDAEPGLGEAAFARVIAGCRLLRQGILLPAGVYALAECPSSVLVNPAD